MNATMELPAAPAQSNGNGGTAIQRASVFEPMAKRFGTSVAGLRQILKATVIKGAGGREVTEEEMAAFAIVANQYGLNPFTKEIHAFADRGRIVPIVGIDGWAHIVNAHQEFDGCDFQEEEDQQGNPHKTTCRMHVKGRGHPVTVTERYAECRRGTEPWKTMPFRMLRHKAFMQAARLAFSVSGLYDEDEARDIIGHADPTLAAAQSMATGSRTAGVLRKVTERPVSENQTFEPTATAEDALAAQAAADGETIEVDRGADGDASDQVSQALDGAAPDVSTWASTLAAAEEAARAIGMDPATFDTAVNLYVVKAGAKGKEDRKLSRQQRLDLVAAVREKRLNPDGTIKPAS
jgi:phage recombination protein Bet